MQILALRDFWQILKGALYEWNEDKVPRMAGALAFYTIFALTPTVILAVAVGSLFYDRQNVIDEMLDQAQTLIGSDGRAAIVLLLENAPEAEGRQVATILGLIITFLAATGAFTELKDSLNTIWEVKPKPGLALWPMLWDRMLSFAMMLVIGFLLVVSLVLSAIVHAVGRSFTQAANFLILFLIITALFALIFKYLPDVKVRWKDVWLGAALTSVLFMLGRLMFGWYLGHSTISSAYGAASSLVIVVLWTYYSSLIILFGAEVTQVQAKYSGVSILPEEMAVHLSEHERVVQGIPHLEEFQTTVDVHEAHERAREILHAEGQRPRRESGVVLGMLGLIAGWLLGRRDRK